MLKSILLALDQSKASDNAQQYAIKLAHLFKAKLTGIAVLDSPWMIAPQAVPIGAAIYKYDMDERLLEDARGRLRQIEKKFEEACEVAKIKPRLVEAEGDPYDEIEDELERHDLLIIGKDANFHFDPDEGLAGTLRQLLHDNPRPIIITPEAPHEGDGVLVAYDGSLAAARSLHLAILLGLLHQKKVHILSVHDERSMAEHEARHATILCDAHDIPVTVHAVTSNGFAAKIINEQIQRLNIGLVVMGAFGHQGIVALFKGSTTKEMVKNSAVPLFFSH